MSTSSPAAGTPEYPGSSVAVTHPSLFFPDPHLIRKFLDISSIKSSLFWVPFPWVLARKGKVIVHFFLLLSNVLTYYWWSLETGDYSTDFRHQAGSMVGMFLRVGKSVNGYQAHSEWDIIHPGLSTNEAIPAPTQNWARGCVPAPVSAPLLSPGPHVPEWGRPCCFWLRAKDIPGSHPPPMTLQGWSINTSALSALGEDQSEAWVLSYDLTFPCGFSVTHSGKWIIMYLLLAASPSFLMFPVLHKSTTCTEILFSVSASGGPKRRQGVPSRNGRTACTLHSLIMPRLWQPPVGSLASTPLFPLHGHGKRLGSPHQSQSPWGDVCKGQPRLKVFSNFSE